MQPALVGTMMPTNPASARLQLLGEDQRPDQHVLVGDALVGGAIDDRDLLLVSLRRPDEALVKAHVESFRSTSADQASGSSEPIRAVASTDRCTAARGDGRHRGRHLQELRRSTPGPRGRDRREPPLLLANRRRRRRRGRRARTSPCRRAAACASRGRSGPIDGGDLRVPAGRAAVGEQDDRARRRRPPGRRRTACRPRRCPVRGDARCAARSADSPSDPTAASTV